MSEKNLAHPECHKCSANIRGEDYILRDDKPFCVNCYNKHFANFCKNCNLVIEVETKDLSYKTFHWHEKCFNCSSCTVSLVDQHFGFKNGNIYCSKCYELKFGPKCHYCSQPFQPGKKKLEWGGKEWHPDCFLCDGCFNPIGSDSFMPKNNKNYCLSCYNEKFAFKCAACKESITGPGVLYKRDTFHKECFTCTECSTSLIGQKFTAKDSRPYCVDCFGKFFAKKCSNCQNPVIGIGSSKFIVFDDKHWHNECFNCNSCNSNLAGLGFICVAGNITCTKCVAKMKQEQHAESQPSGSNTRETVPA